MGKRDDLIERALRVAHGTFRRPRHQQQRGVVDRNFFRVGKPAEQIRDRVLSMEKYSAVELETTLCME